MRRRVGSACPQLLLLVLVLVGQSQAFRPWPRSWAWSGHGAKRPGPHIDPRIEKRIEGEHVVLADCVRDGVAFSEMAYYSTPNGTKPIDVATVNMTTGETADWVGHTTSALFTSTTTTFKAVLGSPEGEGQYAGSGDNGYPGPFYCYVRRVANRYVDKGAVCSQLYDCTHDAPPGSTTDTQIPGGSSASPSASSVASESAPSIASDSASPSTSTSAPTSASTSKSTPTIQAASADAQSPDTGLSQGALIGIVVGAVGTLLAAALGGGIYWLCRRSRRRNGAGNNKHGTRGCCGCLFRRPAAPPAELHGDGMPVAAPSPFKAWTPKTPLTPAPMCEMDGRWYRVEMPIGNDKYEMDGQGRVMVEMDGRWYRVEMPVGNDKHEMDGQGRMIVEMDGQERLVEMDSQGRMMDGQGRMVAELDATGVRQHWRGQTPQPRYASPATTQLSPFQLESPIVYDTWEAYQRANRR